MRDEPVELKKEIVAAALRVHWGIEAARLEYAPVGFGSYHWVAEALDGRRWFVTADDLRFSGAFDTTDPDAAFAALHAAYGSAASLCDAGLAFVLEPLPGVNNQVFRRILPSWGMGVYPFVEGESHAYGEWPDPAQHDEAARLVGTLHNTAAPDSLVRWDPAIPHRSVYGEALSDIEQDWHAGPYAEPARRQLAAHRDGVARLFERYDLLAARLMAAPDAWVVTHGEPHSANFIWARDGSTYLIDWQTVRLAPRERDLFVVAGSDEAALAAYTAVAGVGRPRPEAMELFHLRWTLLDTCICLRRFRSPHVGSEDDDMSWREFELCLRVAEV